MRVYFMFRNEIAALPRFQPGCGQVAATAPQYCVVIASEVGKWRNWILCFAPCCSPAAAPASASSLLTIGTKPSIITPSHPFKLFVTLRKDCLNCTSVDEFN